VREAVPAQSSRAKSKSRDCFGQKADEDKGCYWGKHFFPNHLLAMKGFEKNKYFNKCCK
jgi:hypothetical protein